MTTSKRSGKIVGPSTGASTTGAANVPGVPAFVSNDSGTITISVDENANSAVVVYAIYCSELAKYVGADGVVDEASETWQDMDTWGESIEMSGFADSTSYTFKTKAKDEAGVETAFSSDSAPMNTNPGVDYGPTSENLNRKTSGNTIIDETAGIVISGTTVATGEETQDTLPEYYGEITVTYTLKNNYSTESRIIVEYSKNNSDWNPATDAGGDDSEGLTGLATTPDGETHVFVWDSYTDAGTSELDTSVYIRITPYDASPTGGNAGPAVSADAFAVNNRPGKIAWENADGYTYDKDTTPVFIATIPLLRGGTKGFPGLHVYKSDGTTLVMDRLSIECINGWEYEDTPDSWNSLTAAGIPVAVIDGINRVRYTIQAADALTANLEYIINGEMGEIRDRG